MNWVEMSTRDVKGSGGAGVLTVCERGRRDGGRVQTRSARAHTDKHVNGRARDERHARCM